MGPHVVRSAAYVSIREHMNSATLLMSLYLATPPIWPSLEAGGAVTPAPTDAALLVAVEDYFAVDDVPGAVDNAADWYRWLRKGRGLAAANIVILRDHQATREVIEAGAARAAKQVGAGGTLWFVFVGHGAPSVDGKDALLLGVDVQPNVNSIQTRGVGRDAILTTLSKGKQARVVAVMDACFSGRTPSNQPLIAGLQPLVPVVNTRLTHRVILLTAAAHNQFAGPLPGAARPAFSYLTLGALRGWADGNRDLSVTAEEAHRYVSDAMNMLVLGRSQTPGLAAKDVMTPLSVGARERGPDLDAIRLGLSAKTKKVTPPLEPRGRGVAVIATDPPGGVVFLGAERLGEEPVRIELDSGPFNFTVAWKDYVPQTVRLTVAPGAPQDHIVKRETPKAGRTISPIAALRDAPSWVHNPPRGAGTGSAGPGPGDPVALANTAFFRAVTDMARSQKTHLHATHRRYKDIPEESVLEPTATTRMTTDLTVRAVEHARWTARSGERWVSVLPAPAPSLTVSALGASNSREPETTGRSDSARLASLTLALCRMASGTSGVHVKSMLTSHSATGTVDGHDFEETDDMSVAQLTVNAMLGGVHVLGVMKDYAHTSVADGKKTDEELASANVKLSWTRHERRHEITLQDSVVHTDSPTPLLTALTLTLRNAGFVIRYGDETVVRGATVTRASLTAPANQ